MYLSDEYIQYHLIVLKWVGLPHNHHWVFLFNVLAACECGLMKFEIHAKSMLFLTSCVLHSCSSRSLSSLSASMFSAHSRRVLRSSWKRLFLKLLLKQRTKYLRCCKWVIVPKCFIPGKSQIRDEVCRQRCSRDRWWRSSTCSTMRIG